MAADRPTVHAVVTAGFERCVYDDGGKPRPVLVWRFPTPSIAVSTAPLGGGLGLRGWAVNAQVSDTYDRGDPDAHLIEMSSALGLAGPGVGMLTAVDLETVFSQSDRGAHADVSVGTTHPTWAADDEWVDTSVGPARPGTINIVAFVPERLSPAALVNAVATVTEAKAQALWESGVPATGTASDAVCVSCPGDGPEHPYGGPRSLWGARLARAVHRAVVAGCASERAS